MDPEIEKFLIWDLSIQFAIPGFIDPEEAKAFQSFWRHELTEMAQKSQMEV